MFRFMQSSAQIIALRRENEALKAANAENAGYIEYLAMLTDADLPIIDKGSAASMMDEIQEG